MSGDDVFVLASGRTARIDLLTDAAHLAGVLEELPGLVGMTAIRDPVVTVATGNPGLEGYVPIDLSNITVSTYTDPARVVVCVHSCREVPVAPVLALVQRAFGCTTVRSLVCREGDFR